MSVLAIMVTVFAVWYLVLGLPMVFGNKIYCRILADFFDEEDAVWSWGFWAIAIGIVILSLTGYRVAGEGYLWVMPLIGWLALLKGIGLLWVPKALLKIGKPFCHPGGTTMLLGIILVLLGVFLWRVILPLY